MNAKLDMMLEVAAAMHERGDDVWKLDLVKRSAGALLEDSYGATMSPLKRLLAGVLATHGGDIKAAQQDLRLLPGGGDARVMVERARMIVRAPKRYRGRGLAARGLSRLVGLLLIGIACAASLFSLPVVVETEHAMGAALAVDAAIEGAFQALTRELGDVSDSEPATGDPVEKPLGFFNSAAAKLQALGSSSVHPVRVLARSVGPDSIGLKLVTIPSLLMGAPMMRTPEAVIENLLVWARGEKISVTWKCPAVGRDGVKNVGTYTWPRRIQMCPGYKGPVAAEITAHELAHHLQGERNRLERAKALTEDEADAVALTALKALGVGVTARDGGYLSRRGEHLTGIIASRQIILEMATELARAGLGIAGEKPS